MPLYEYECAACGNRFELIRKFSDVPVEVCVKCGRGPVTRLFSSPAIQFKGTGWYITDYAQKGKTDSSGAATKESKKETATSGESAEKGSAEKGSSETNSSKTDTARGGTTSSSSTASDSSKAKREP